MIGTQLVTFPPRRLLLPHVLRPVRDRHATGDRRLLVGFQEKRTRDLAAHRCYPSRVYHDSVFQLTDSWGVGGDFWLGAADRDEGDAEADYRAAKSVMRVDDGRLSRS